MQHRDITATRRGLIALCALIAFLALPAAGQAGPWVKQPGQSYVKLSGGVFSSDKVFDLDGDLVESEYSYSHRSLRAYGELGLFPSTAVSFSVPFLASQNELNSYTRYKRWGPGDLDVAIQISLHEDGCAASVAPGARIPLYDGTVGSQGGVNVRQGSTGTERYTPALGDGSVDLGATGSFGCSLYPLPAWFGLSAGPRLRLNGFGPSLDYGVDGGFFVWPERLAVTARVGGVQRLTSDNERPTKSYVNLAGGLLVNVYGGFALEAEASYIPAGAFVARGWSANLGVSFNGEVFANPFD
jgi:hypothetical protein